jgi:hypothetical protein
MPSSGQRRTGPGPLTASASDTAPPRQQVQVICQCRRTRAASKIAVSQCPRVTPRRLGEAPARLAPQAETRRLRHGIDHELPRHGWR